jgi:hypothetical protein
MRTIINQNTDLLALPDLRNLGTILRILLAVNAMVFVAAVASECTGRRSPKRGCKCRRWSSRSCSSVLVLYAIARWLERLDYRTGAIVVLGRPSQ